MNSASGMRPLPAWATAAVVTFSLIVAPITQGFLRNRFEFDLSATGFVWGLVVLTVVVFAATMGPLRCTSRMRSHLVFALFGLCLLSLMESQLLGFCYAPLTGKAVTYRNTCGRPLPNAALWLVGGGILWWFRRSVVAQQKLLFSTLSGLQAMYLLAALLSGLGTLRMTPSRHETAGQRALSKDHNVLMLVVDSVQTDVFWSLMQGGAIDRAAFDGFTYFRNATSGFSITHASIPNLLSGEFYRNDRPFRDYVAEIRNNATFIPNQAAAANYQMRLYTTPRVLPDVPVASFHRYMPLAGFAMCAEFAAFRQAPSLLKNWIYNDGSWRLSRAFGAKVSHGLVDNVDLYAELPNWSAQATSPQFWVLHLLGAHPPYLHDESLRRVDIPPGRPGYERVVIGVGKLLASTLQRLRALGIYDSTAIIIAADHCLGIPVTIPPHLRKAAPHAAPLVNKGRGLPVLLVKPFNQRGRLVVNDAPVELADIPATVADLLNLPASGERRSVFEHLPGDSRTRFHYELLDTAWDIRTDRLAPMKEWKIEGFSWFTDSWHATGATFGDASELLAAFISRQKGAGFLAEPRALSSHGTPRVQFTAQHELFVGFPGHEVDEGQRVGLALKVVNLDPRKRYGLRIVTSDADESKRPGRFTQQILLGSRLVDDHDVADSSSAEVREVHASIGPGVVSEELVTQVLSSTHEPWAWWGTKLELHAVEVFEAGSDL